MSKTADWGLAPLIDSVGTEFFGSYLMNSMRRLTGANHCNLVRYTSGQNHSQTVFTLGDISSDLASDCAALYDASYHKLDPAFIQTVSAQSESPPAFLHKEFRLIKSQDYRQVLFERCHIMDKASILHSTSDGGYGLHLYRLEGDGRFNNQHLRGAERVVDVLDSLLRKHITLLEQQEVKLDLAWISKKLDKQTDHVLTARELETCSRIILGYSSLAISLNLGISINTVLTHRRKAYEKLGIGTQSQLFCLLMQGTDA